jgi:hypothetical protein
MILVKSILAGLAAVMGVIILLLSFALLFHHVIVPNVLNVVLAGRVLGWQQSTCVAQRRWQQLSSSWDSDGNTGARKRSKSNNAPPESDETSVRTTC